MMLSVIMPCFQAQRFLPNILSDVCNQDYSNWELICVSNGSNQEKQLEVLSEWQAKDERIRIVEIPSSEKGSVSRARNLGIDEAKGDYVCFIDADDRIISKHLSLMVEAIDVDTEIVYGGITQRAISDNKEGNDSPKLLNTSSMIDALLDNDNISAPYNVLIKKNSLKDLRFDEQYTYGEDAVFKMHLMKNAEHVKLIPLTGYIYVRDANNASAVDRYHETMEDAINEKFELLEEILRKYGMDEQAVKKTVHKMYYDVALVPILTNPFHLKTTLSFKGKYKRIKNNFFKNNLPAIIFRECNTKNDSNPFCRLLRMGYKLHSCLFISVILELFYLYKYKKA